MLRHGIQRIVATPRNRISLMRSVDMRSLYHSYMRQFDNTRFPFPNKFYCSAPPEDERKRNIISRNSEEDFDHDSDKDLRALTMFKKLREKRLEETNATSSMNKDRTRSAPSHQNSTRNFPSNNTVERSQVFTPAPNRLSAMLKDMSEEHQSGQQRLNRPSHYHKGNLKHNQNINNNNKQRDNNLYRRQNDQRRYEPFRSSTNGGRESSIINQTSLLDRETKMQDLMQKLKRSAPATSARPLDRIYKPNTRDDKFRDNNNEVRRRQDNLQNRPIAQSYRNNNNHRPTLEKSRSDFLSASNARRNGDNQDNDVSSITTTTTTNTSTENLPRTITLPPASLTITEASSLLRVKVSDIKSKLQSMGVVISDIDRNDDEEDDKTETENASSSSASPSSSGRNPKEEFRLDVDMTELLAMEFGIETERSQEAAILDSKQLLMQQRRAEIDITSEISRFPPRPPVVTIMGHVDHGKTTLMDALRRESVKQQSKPQKASKKENKKSASNKNARQPTDDVAGTEAGGITQVISAFQVALEGHDQKITFLDTPGHAAFTAMRQSGTHAADVIVLVVAADDGVSPQTVEILNLYKSIVKGSSDSGISMVVALNKIDKPGINVDEAKMRIENQLLEHGIISEGMNYTESEFGQPVQVIPTSGLTGQGLEELMEGLLLQSEVMDLRADDTANAEGIIMDARLEKGLGVVADCIIRWGKIEKGDVVVSGDQIARVRMLKDVNDKILKRGVPSQPVRIIGFKSLPKAGDPIMVVESEEAAEEMLEQRSSLEDVENERPDGQSSDVEIHIHGMRRGDTWRVKKVHEKAGLAEADGSIRIPIIVKADADGSLSAIRESLVSLGKASEHFVVVDPISEGIGDITPSDIQMAKESDATVFAFGLKRIDPAILSLAESEGVQICSSDIIYSLLDAAKVSLGAYLPPVPKEHIHGRATVRAIFEIDTENGKERIAGLRVLEGHVYKEKAPAPDEDSSSDLLCHYRVFRDGERISPEGEVVTASSLRRFKDMVESVRRGDECGLGLAGFDGFEEEDEIECYSIEYKKATL